MKSSHSSVSAPRTSSNSSSSSTRKFQSKCISSHSSGCGCPPGASAMKSASRAIPPDWEPQLAKILSYLSGDFNYDNRAKAKIIVRELLGLATGKSA